MKPVAILLFLCSVLLGFSQEQSQSPYLLVNTEDAQVPLKASKMDVQIAGTVAHVQITQVYHNTGTQPIEAKYLFPLSTQAAVHDMRMTIGDRRIKAKIFEKQEAKRYIIRHYRTGSVRQNWIKIDPMYFK